MLLEILVQILLVIGNSLLYSYSILLLHVITSYSIHYTKLYDDMSSPVSFIKRNGLRLFNRYTVFLVGLLLWTEIMQRFGGLPSLRTAWRLEIPLLLYLYWLANGMVRPCRWQPWGAALPLIVIYGIFDCYHIQFGRLLRITEISQLPELRITSYNVCYTKLLRLCGFLIRI